MSEEKTLAMFPVWYIRKNRRIGNSCIVWRRVRDAIFLLTPKARTSA